MKRLISTLFIKSFVFFIVVFLPLNLFAQSNTPNSPEAASFEPIDATDMVNLSTGDFTYVLPLMNVPSPEGGYPVALAYHAGIAMDQEDSWAGLGWNLNPGAINRNVNGYPDDYNHSQLSEFFYDQGGSEEYYSVSVGYSANGALSVGASLSWGSNKALGGAVSVGYGVQFSDGSSIGGNLSVGTEGLSIGVGGRLASGLTLGATASSGSAGINGGFTNTNGSGFSIGASTSGSYSAGFTTSSGNNNLVSLGVNFSSNGVGIRGGVTNRTSSNAVHSGGGIGINVSFENSVDMGDYTVRSSGFMIPIVVPTPVGIFSASFGKQKIRYFLGKPEQSYINGPLNFHNGTSDAVIYLVRCRQRIYQGANSDDSCGTFGPYYNIQEAQDRADELSNDYSPDFDCGCFVETASRTESFMDIYSVPIDNQGILESVDLTANNLTFPSYDNYNVQAQGLSGSMSSPLFDNGTLFGLSNKKYKDASDAKYTANYVVNGGTANLPNHMKFTQKPNFYMRNEISTFIDVQEAAFTTTSNNGILGYYVNNSVESTHKPRRKVANFIEHFTNEQLTNDYANIRSQGYLKPNVDGMAFDRSTLPKDGIGAFKVTAADGKTYHYSLPVYNHETVTRTVGSIKNNDGTAKTENESYFEKRQLEPYATHWLLTSVTGPDFIDLNNDGIANEGDYGYWTNFSYGKWSDSWVWKMPVKEAFIESTQESGVKTRINGRKELYYLNSIKTRTHTALFIKEKDQELQEGWTYSSVLHRDGLDQNSASFIQRFNIPSQRKLYLKRIILYKNSDLANINLFGSNQQVTTINIGYEFTSKSSISSYYNAERNVLTESDLVSFASLPSMKTIELDQELNYNAGVKRELRQVKFKGKNGINVLPPYEFSYFNNTRNFNITDKDEWGYSKHGAEFWSLKQIKTPEGGMINIEYENHSLKSAIDHEFKFTNYTRGTFKSTYPVFSNLQDRFNKKIIISSSTALTLNLGDKVNVNYDGIYPPINGKFIDATYNGLATITRFAGNNSYEVTFDNPVNLVGTSNTCNVSLVENYLNSSLASHHPNLPNISRKEWAERYYRLTEVSFTSKNKVLQQGGIRASKVAVTDGVNEYATTYSYGKDGNGIGYVSYLPYAPELEKEMPYSSELPASKPMYDYVSVESKDINGVSHGRTEYHFNILKEKTANDIKFGNFYEIDIDYSNTSTNPNNNKQVNISKYTVKDNVAAVGQLLSVTTYNSKGQVLSKTQNSYYQPGQTPNNYGMTKQSFQSYKEVDFDDAATQDKWVINTSSRITYPNLLKSTKSLSGGYTFESEFTQFNPDTGQSDEIISMDSRGIRFKSENLPAYKIYTAMGSKVDNVYNRNMLSQPAMSKSFIDQNGQWKIISAGITTWNNDWRYFNDDGSYERTIQNDSQKVWREHKTYIWNGILNGDGTYQNFSGNYDDFNWGLGSYVSVGNDLEEHTVVQPSTADWKLVSEITAYNNYSMPLEVKDINGNYASTKKDINHDKVISSSNAAYTEQFYSGAEDKVNGWAGGQIGIWNFSSGSFAHTGKYAEVAGGGSKNFKCYPIPRLKTGQASKRFKVSVWANKGNHDNARIVVGSSIQPFNGETVTAANWVQLNHYVDLSTKTEVYVTSNSGTIYFDDFRLLPAASNLTSYVYNDYDELSYILGTNNLATKYEYDSAGRLVRVYNEVADNGSIQGGFKLAKEMDYRYKSNTTILSPPVASNPLRIESFNGSVSACISQEIAPIGGTTPIRQYRWAQGASPDNLILGPWTSDLCIDLTLEPCRNTFYKMVIRDVSNGVTREWSGSYFNRVGCPPKNPGSPIPVLDEGETTTTIRRN